MHYLRLFLILTAFWLFLSGHYVTLILSLGVLSILIVTALVRRMDRVEGEVGGLRIGIGLFRYLGWLMWQVVLSNIDVARRIWDPALPIKRTWQRVDTKVSTPWERTLYANSITLTPGTLTTDVKDDHFMIHCLTQDGIDQLREGGMEARIRRLGI